MKISMSTYFMYGYIPNVYTIADVQIWSHTPCTCSSLGQICPISWDTHVGVATSLCRMDLYMNERTNAVISTQGLALMKSLLSLD